MPLLAGIGLSGCPADDPATDSGVAADSSSGDVSTTASEESGATSMDATTTTTDDATTTGPTSTGSSTTGGFEGDRRCVQAAEALQACGETVTSRFVDECELDLISAENCHPACLVSIEGCYSIERCTTLDDVSDCVGAAFGWETCLCDDGNEGDSGSSG